MRRFALVVVALCACRGKDAPAPAPADPGSGTGSGVPVAVAGARSDAPPAGAASDAATATPAGADAAIAPPTDPKTAYLISTRSVGPITHDTAPTVAELARRVPDLTWSIDKTNDAEGNDVTFLVGAASLAPSLSAMLSDQGGIFLVQITDDRYATAKGIKVGSTVKQLGTAYPDVVCELSETEVTELTCVAASFGKTTFRVELPDGKLREGKVKLAKIAKQKIEQIDWE